MHIVHIQDRHYEHTGYEVSYLSREQARLGHIVTVVTSDEFVDSDGNKRKRAGEYTHDGCTIIRLQSFRVLGPRLWLRGLGGLLQTLNPDVIHCHGIFDFTSARTARIRRHLTSALVCDCHAADFNTRASGPLRRFCYALFRETAGRTIKRESSTISAIGEPEQEFVCRELGLTPSQVPITRLGVDTETFQPFLLGRKTIRVKLGLEDGDVLLLHAGSLRHSKNLPLLLKALELAKTTSNRVHLTIIGSGDQSSIDEIHREVETRGLQQRVRHQSFIEHADLPDYYSAADIAIWPGNISTAVLEAMASGLPLIAVDTPYNRALRGDGGAHLFPKGDALALADLIRRLSTDDDLRRRSGFAAREHMVADFDSRLIAARHVDNYQRAIEHRATASPSPFAVVRGSMRSGGVR